MKDRFRDAETMVRYILAHFPNARSDDKLLLLYYWRMADKIDIPAEVWRQIMTKATTPETITRMRRKIQHDDGNYPARGEVEKGRMEKAGLYRSLFAKGGKGLDEY